MNINLLGNREFKILTASATITFFITLLAAFAAFTMKLSFNFLGIVLLLSYITLILILCLVMNSHYNKIKTITLEIERISRGGFGGLAENQKLGDVDILEFQLYQLSKRLKADQERNAKDKALIKETMSGLSHQLKTPLAVIRTYNDLLLEGAIRDITVAEDFISRSSEQIDKLERIVHMFLKVSKIEAGVALIKKSNNSINSTIEKIVLSLSEKAHVKNQTLTFERVDPLIVFYDSEWMYEAIYNVIDNALEYTQSHGCVTVSIKKADTHVKIEIQDTGIGIDQKDIPYIFNIFYQGEKAKKQNVSSSGIGLALTKLIIDRHSGVIKVKSKLGCGTRFTIILPMDSL